MTRVSRRWLTAVVAALAAATLSAFAAVSPAHASYYGNAYLVFSNANCVGGGSIVSVYGAVDQSWSGGDAGDNVIYPRVRVGTTNVFNGRALCQRPWWAGGSYWINLPWKQFYPSRNGQTFWF